MSAGQVADSGEYPSQIAKGRKPGTPKLFCRLAEALDVGIDEFVRRQG